MGSSFVNEVSISGRMNESDNEGEGGLEQFSGFTGQLVSYPPSSDAFRKFCKAKVVVGGSEYFDGDVRSDLSEGFLCYLSQLEYGLSLPLTNLAKRIMNTIGVCPVQMNGNMWELYEVKNFKASGGSYLCASVTRRRFFNLNSAGRSRNDNIIWVKVNCLQRDDDEPLDLRFRSVKKNVKSTVENKESPLDEVTEEEAELELILRELSMSRKKRVDSRSNKVRKAQSTRSMAAVDEGRKKISGEEARAKTHGSGSLAQLNLTTSKIAQKFPKRQIKKALPASGNTGSGEVATRKRRRVEPLGGSEMVIEGRSASMDDLKEVEERARLLVFSRGFGSVRDRLGRHLMLKGYSQEEVDVIKVDTYAEEEEEEVEVLGVMDGLDGVSPQMALDNQGDNVELPEGWSEKVVRKMSLRINDLESGLARE
ncbi:hypothetical protein GIB67_002208 [Kingdonia uniflora]|uniref:Uncharacterized protein n=1 Tax=Kingdonia uniflora TaxID=39325 RepID=A0A7J7KWT7_9MAGN|nr:hypothetical protein GIB67_002208 [Kingdonia uniflora]